MARRIPHSFHPRNEQLDPLERYIRDILQVDIVSWAMFRYAIHVGTDAKFLRSQARIPQVVKQAYIELGKTHYTVVTSVGFAEQSLEYVKKRQDANDFLFHKSLKEFYVHVGSVLDNLARLIFIINHPNCTTLRKKGKLVRHWITWNSLKQNYNITGYNRILTSRKVKEILNIRNNFVHNWICSIFVDPNTGVLYWPKAIRYRRNYLWPYEEKGMLIERYKRYVNLLTMVDEDYRFMESLQDRIFKKLISDIKKFEHNNRITIG